MGQAAVATCEARDASGESSIALAHHLLNRMTAAEGEESDGEGDCMTAGWGLATADELLFTVASSSAAAPLCTYLRWTHTSI